MASIKAIDLRRGQAVAHKGGIWTCISNEKVAKGNWRSSQVIQLKNVQTGQLVEDRYRTEEHFELAILERKVMNYLYSEADHHVVMDMETFEEVRIPKDLIGNHDVYLAPNLEISIAFVEGQAIITELPINVTLTVVDTPPEIKGATVTNAMKEAVCEGGARVKVPPFVTNGTKIIVDTRTGHYSSRA